MRMYLQTRELALALPSAESSVLDEEASTAAPWHTATGTLTFIVRLPSPSLPPYHEKKRPKLSCMISLFESFRFKHQHLHIALLGGLVLLVLREFLTAAVLHAACLHSALLLREQEAA